MPIYPLNFHLIQCQHNPPPPSPHKRKKEVCKKKGSKLRIASAWLLTVSAGYKQNHQHQNWWHWFLFSNASIISLTSQWQTDMRKTTKTKINSIDTEAIKRTESSKKNINQSLPKKMLIKRSFTLLLNLLRVEKRTWYKLDISLSLEI